MRLGSVMAIAGVLSVALGCPMPAGAQGAGDVVIVFEVAPAGGGEKTDVDLYAQRLSPDGKLVWNDGEPAAVGASRDLETSPAACGDGQGGVIVVYVYEFTTGEHQGDVDIVAQRIDGSGKPVWNDGGTPQPVSTSKGKESRPLVVADGQGGAFVVYEWQDEEGDIDVLAQRLDAEGKLMWNNGESPVVLGASDGVERNAVAIPDDKGGLVVLFEWQDEAGDADIMAQHVTGDGQVLWNEGKRATDVASSTALERHVVAIPDGQGGALAAFEVEYVEGEFKGDVDIMAQRISGEGALLWNGGEKAADVSTGQGIERNPAAVSDGEGGMIAVCEYEPLEGEFAGDIDVLAQRLSPEGKRLWNEGEKSSMVSSAKGLERVPEALAAGEGGALVVFENEFREGENAGDIDILAQRISATGELAWGDGERSSIVGASKWLERAPLILPDGEGGAIVIYPATGPEGDFEGDLDIEAVRISADGELLWNKGEKAVDVAAGKGLERSPCAVLVK